jgi:DNA-binding MarR family transcriptional regulator
MRKSIQDAGVARLVENETPAVAVFRLVLMLAQRLRYLMDHELKADDLTTQQAMLITVVELLGGAPRFSEAADALAMSHQNLKQLASALERKGFVELSVDKTDRRARRIQVTERSRSYWQRRASADHALVDAAMATLSKSELRETVQLLTKLAHGVAGHYKALTSETR